MNTSTPTTVSTLLKNLNSQVHIQRADEPANGVKHLTGFRHSLTDSFYDRSLAVFNRQKKSHDLKKRVHDQGSNEPVVARPSKGR